MLQIETRDKFLLTIFGVLVMITTLDVYSDLSQGTSLEHVLTEIVILLLSLLGILWLGLGIRNQQKKIAELHSALDTARKAERRPDQYILDARKKLGNAVEQQFEEWNLSKSERDIGWLLLKGLSLKEIAIMRNTMEKTVRQQASAIYGKAGISGRHAFSAWFFEDIL